MNVYLDFIGCRLNEAEIERFARQFRAAGHTLVDEAAQADIVVVNTCAVTAAAASDSRQKVRQAARSGSEIVVTGCWATLEPQAAARLPGVRSVVANGDKDSLVPRMLGLPQDAFDLEPIARTPLPGAHSRTRAFIKVQDGCDNRCTFCVTTLARGAGRSRLIPEVLADVRAALHGGAREIVLTGVHLGSWGRDLEPRQRLAHLVSAILSDTDVQRLRLSSLEPWDLDPDFFQLWSDRRLCPHLHLPLQSGSGTILRRMARKTTPATFSKLVEQAHSAIPDVAVTTDVIVGFPGEGEAEFEESLEFVQSMEFAGGHVFSYSPRPGTAAAAFVEQVPPALRRERNARMRAVLAQAAQAYGRRFLGQPVEVLWEAGDAYGPQGWRLRGLTGNYLRVTALSADKLWNRVSRVRLQRMNAEGLEGTILDQAQGGGV